MENTAHDLLSTHPVYDEYIENWRFLNNSYLGGRHYKSQDYLTRYVYETAEQYRNRVNETPLDNHCSSIIDIYNSLLFAEPPVREFGSLSNNPMLDGFLEDADRDDRSFDDFMSEVDRVSAVYGHAWVIIDKPAVDAATRADEQALNIRPYVSLFAPPAVLDWEYSREPNGVYKLTYLKVVENESADIKIVKVFTPDTIETYAADEHGKGELVDMVDNPLGYVPAVCAYDTRSSQKGVGISAIEGPADVQRSIFNQNSEIQQLMLLSNHPSLVITQDVKAAAGAGSIITMPDNMDGALKPYLLQPNAGNLDSIRANIKDSVDAINRMANVGSIRVLESRQLSGVAMDTEYRLLSARIAKKADQVELAEEQIWQIFANWMGTEWNGYIEYPDSFNTRDKLNDLNTYKMTQELLPTNSALNDVITRKVAELITDDADEIDAIITGGSNETILP